jgi:xylulokinase
VLLPKDYVRLQMTGGKATDVSDAAGTLWLDVQKRCWSEPMLAATGLSLGHMPRCHEGNEVTGVLRRAVASSWGMNSVPVIAGGGDNAAGAVAMGVVADGDAMLSLGTSGVVFVATAQHRANPGRAVHAFCHCLPGMWHQMAVQLSAASCVDWAARLTGLGDTVTLLARAEAAADLGRPEMFLPYLSGERTPHNDPHARGALLGLSHDTDAAAVAQAVLEGVAFAVADGVVALSEAGTRLSQLTVVGGGARSRYWGRIIAAALNLPLVYRSGGEVGPALGAARLARLSALGGDAASLCAAPAVEQVVQPRASDVAALQDKQFRYRAAYAAIKPLNSRST